MKKLIFFTLALLSVSIQAQTFRGTFIGDGRSISNSTAWQMLGSSNVVFAGAIGDGVTDNTAAFQSVLNTHSNIYVPAGRFVIGNIYSKFDGQRIYGSGNNSILIPISTLTNYMVNMTNTHCRLESLVFDTTLTNNWWGGTVASQSGFGTFSNKSAIWINGIGNSVVDKCNIINWPGYGMAITGNPNINTRLNNYLITGNYVTNCYRGIVALGSDSSQYGRILGNLCKWNWTGLETRSANIEVTGNVVIDGQCLWRHAPEASTGYGHLNFVGNTCNHGSYGFYVTNCQSGVNISANNFLSVGECYIINSTRCMVKANYLEASGWLEDLGSGTNEWSNNTFTPNSLAYATGFNGFTNTLWIYNFLQSKGYTYVRTNNTAYSFPYIGGIPTYIPNTNTLGAGATIIFSGPVTNDCRHRIDVTTTTMGGAASSALWTNTFSKPFRAIPKVTITPTGGATAGEWSWNENAPFVIATTSGYVAYTAYTVGSAMNSKTISFDITVEPVSPNAQ